MPITSENVVPNIITPLFQGVVYIALILGVLYIIYLITKQISPNLKFWMKYSLFRKKFDEDATTKRPDWITDTVRMKQPLFPENPFFNFSKNVPKIGYLPISQ